MNSGETELEKHAHDEAFGRIIRHHSGNRLSGKGAVEDMQRANVVYLFQHPPCDSNANDCSLTTYGEVSLCEHVEKTWIDLAQGCQIVSQD